MKLDGHYGAWADVLIKCEERKRHVLLAFDAPVCRGPRHDSTWAAAAVASTSISNSISTQTETTGNWQNAEQLQDHADSQATKHPFSYLPPAIANFTLAQSGCSGCGTSPEGPVTYPESPPAHLPLLDPLPLCDASVRKRSTTSSFQPYFSQSASFRALR